MKSISVYRRNIIAAVGASAMLMALPGVAQPLPSIVRLVVPYAPGGGTDILARHVAEGMAAELGTTVVVENKPGASTNIGTQDVTRSAPDGSTLLMGDLALAVNPSLFKKLPFDPMKDLAPVAMVAKAPLVLVVNSASGIKTVSELVARAKGSPDKITFASAGTGNPPHLAGELFRLTTQSNIVHVPYKGVGPALTDILGGHVTMMFTGISSTKQHIDEGNLTALAVTGAQRAPTLPTVPTMAEAGYPDADVSSWWAIYGPAGLPSSLANTYAVAIEKALRNGPLRERLEKQNIVASFENPESLRVTLRNETKKWAEVVRAAKIVAD